MDLQAMYKDYTNKAEQWINNTKVVSVPTGFVDTSIKSLVSSFALSFVGGVMYPATGSSRYNAGIRSGCYGLFSAMTNICFKIILWNECRRSAQQQAYDEDQKQFQASLAERNVSTTYPSLTPSPKALEEYEANPEVIQEKYAKWMSGTVLASFLATMEIFQNKAHFGLSCVAQIPNYYMNTNYKEWVPMFGIVAK